MKLFYIFHFNLFSINYKYRSLVPYTSILSFNTLNWQPVTYIKRSSPHLNALRYDDEEYGENDYPFALKSLENLKGYFWQRRISLNHLLTMKILIHKHMFSEKLIDVSIIAQHLLKRGLKIKFLKALNGSINFYSFPVDGNDHFETRFLPFKILNSTNILASNELHRLPLQQQIEELDETPSSKILSLNIVNYHQSTIFHNLNTLSPSFSLISEKVSKKVRKFTRGKSGRYTHFWIYLPPHKRRTWICRQISNEITFQTHKKLTERFNSVLVNFLQNPEEHYLTQTMLKTYQIIFKNYRQTLLKTYRRERQLLK